MSVTLQWTVSHWSFLLQISDRALDCKASSAWQVGEVGSEVGSEVGADVDWEPVFVCVPDVVADTGWVGAVVTRVGMVVAVCAKFSSAINHSREYF